MLSKCDISHEYVPPDRLKLKKSSREKGVHVHVVFMVEMVPFHVMPYKSVRRVLELCLRIHP
jgi:hypothetical protein